MDQLANWALCNPEDQSSDLQHPHDEPSIATHTHIHTHSVDVAEMGGTLGLAGQMGESGSMRDRPKIGWRVMKKTLGGTWRPPYVPPNTTSKCRHTHNILCSQTC